MVRNGELLYFSGNHIPAVTGAVQAFTDAKFAKTLVSKMQAPGGGLPHYYQLVLKVRSMDDMPIDFSYVFHRELLPDKNAPAVDPREVVGNKKSQSGH